MRRLAALLFAFAGFAVASGAFAEGLRTHQVAPGQTLGAIAKRYHVSIAALCGANGIERRAPIRPGQKLVIPSPDDEDGSEAAQAREEAAAEARAAASKSGGSKSGARSAAEPPPKSGIQTLDVPGAPPAYYYEPVGRGRLGLRPVIMYLHGRSGNPAQQCQRWAPVARRLGWLVCPSGQEDRGGGARGWDNDWPAAERVVMNTLAALREKYGGRVQLRGNTLVGFSEGAYVAMNVGVREPRTFNRWLILAASDAYWGGAGLEALQQNRRTLRRVYLITGEHDGVIDGTAQVRRWLEANHVAVRASTPADMGHEVALESKAPMYRAALTWLDAGDPAARPRGGKQAERAPAKKKKGRER
ncbi:MAG: LysM peptidoglycan-binding domain-containing protein [Polyangiaceae bacterium]|nr:LysM peptidoglycan-binding domain-containing protein [Polyangiaceae bacterium]